MRTLKEIEGRSGTHFLSNAREDRIKTPKGTREREALTPCQGRRHDSEHRGKPSEQGALTLCREKSEVHVRAPKEIE
jgi:hypothetical protein